MIATGELVGSVVILGGVATVFGAFISLANAKFKVWEDPRIDGVRGPAARRRLRRLRSSGLPCVRRGRGQRHPGAPRAARS